MLRLFIATDPPPELMDELKKLVDALKAPHDGVKWARPNGIHLTVKFFGNVQESRIPTIIDVSRRACSGIGEIRLTVKGIGTFPGGSRPRVLWVGLEGDIERIAELRDALDDALNGAGFPREERGFTAHLTLGRVKERMPVELVRKIESVKDVTLGDMVVSGFHLFKSDLRPTGAVYTSLAYFSII